MLPMVLDTGLYPTEGRKDRKKMIIHDINDMERGGVAACFNLKLKGRFNAFYTTYSS